MSDTSFPRSSFNRYPALWLALYFAAGVALGKYAEAGLAVALATAASLVTMSLLKRSGARFVLPLIFVPLGIICFQVQTFSVTEDRIRRVYSENRIESGDPVEIEGVLAGLPEPAFGGIFMTLRVEQLLFKNSEQRVSGRIRLFAPMYSETAADEYAQLDLRNGSRIKVMCRLEREERFRNPGVTSRIEILDEKGIDATGTIKSALLIEKIGEEPVFLPLAWVSDSRQRLISAFRENFSDRTAGVMVASLLGDKNFLDRQTAEAFREGGTFHVLVISGLHITFIGGLTLWVLSFFTRSKVWQFVLSSTFLWCYTFAVGAEVPVVRASLMFSFLLFSRVIYRSGSLLNALGTCTLLLLVWRPSDLFTASFQLTFVSVASIVACAFPLIEKLRAIGAWTPSVTTPLPPIAGGPMRRVCEFFYWNQSVWQIENSRQIWSANLFKSPYLKWFRAPNLQALVGYIFESTLVSLIVQIWMLPLLVIYFHRISPISVLMNLWVGVLLALESFSAIIAVLLNSFSRWLAAPLILITEFLNSTMLFGLSRVSIDGLAGSRVPVYAGQMRTVYALFGIAVVVATAGIFRWDPYKAFFGQKRQITVTSLALALILGSLIIFHPYSAPDPSGRLKIDFLDVGQGDSALVTFPNGQTMLVDGGGRVSYSNDRENDFEPDVPRIGEAVVSEFLWEKGYSRIDYLVATHADADHIQGLMDVAGNFEIGNVLVGAMASDKSEFAQLMSVCERRSIPVTSIAHGDGFSIGGAEVNVLNSRPDESSVVRSSNNASVVMLITFGTRRFLLTADIEREAEEWLVSIDSGNLRGQIVKVPHHGSRTSSTDSFVKITDADIAIISVGRKSQFGHPHREVVARWRNAGARVMTTGENGTITIDTNGEDLEIETFVPNKGR